jgi:hypothetical protein
MTNCTSVINKRRIEFDAKLRMLLGSSNVYFQPPANLRMKYPCFMYQRNLMSPFFADNIPYKSHHVCYAVTYIDPNPDSCDDILTCLADFPMARFDRHFTQDGLNHDIFYIYY